MKNRAFYLKILSLIIVIMIAALDVMFVFRHKSDYSETENRSLQTFPDISVSSLLSGRATSQWDDYISDQFPLRSAFAGLNSLKERLTGSLENNSIIRASDGYLIRRFTEPSKEEYYANLSALTSFAGRYPDVTHTMLLVPSAVTVYHGKLPYGAAGDEEDGYITRMLNDLGNAGIYCVDVRSAFNESDAQLYYRTDHHWTTDAAKIAWEQYASAKGMPYGSWTRLVATTGFKGTLSAGSIMRTGDTDSVVTYIPAGESDTAVSVTYVQEGRRAPGVYDLSALEKRDCYRIFFGGNHARVNIDSGAAGGTLLVFKDSYANCFIPFLIPQYRRIIVIDPRYFTGSVEEIMEAEEVTEVLYLYNASTLAGDKSLRADIT